MHFQFCLTTLPPNFHESVQDNVLLIGAGLKDCGCDVTVDNERVVYGGKTINLVLENFDNETTASLVQTKKVKGADFPLGVVLTENLGDKNVMAGEFAWRGENFRRVAEIADFVWYFMPGSRHYPDMIDPAKSGQFEFGYSPHYRNVPLATHRDIDFFLPGLTYPRRKPILERLHALGYHVRTSDLTVPAYIYNNLMGRARAIIELKRFDDIENMSPGRVVLGATNGIAVIAEQFDRTELSYLYDYTVTTDFDGFVDRCVHLAEHEDLIATGLEKQAQFARERPLKPNVERLLAAPVFDRYRA